MRGETFDGDVCVVLTCCSVSVLLYMDDLGNISFQILKNYPLEFKYEEFKSVKWIKSSSLTFWQIHLAN